MEIKQLLYQVIEELKDDSIVHAPSQFQGKIPTLEKGYYRKASNQLSKRFELI